MRDRNEAVSSNHRFITIPVKINSRRGSCPNKFVRYGKSPKYTLPISLFSPFLFPFEKGVFARAKKNPPHKNGGFFFAK